MTSLTTAQGSHMMLVLRTFVRFWTAERVMKWRCKKFSPFDFPRIQPFRQVISIHLYDQMNFNNSYGLNICLLQQKSQSVLDVRKMSSNICKQSRTFHSSSQMYRYESARKSSFNVAELLGNVEGSDEVHELFQGLIAQNRASLARSITLIESTHPVKRKQAQLLLMKVLEHKMIQDQHLLKGPRSFRVGK